jgi:hypothetical protein
MHITEYKRSESEPVDDILAALEGTVFHVTKLVNLPLILQCNEIRPNPDGSLPSTFGSSINSFFRRRGCVSLFDYRPEVSGELSSEELYDFRCRCWPFQPAQPEKGGIAIFILDPAEYPVLETWERWKETKSFSEMVVPHVEAGYPGPIPLHLIKKIITLEVTEDPNSFAAVYRAAAKSRQEE